MKNRKRYGHKFMTLFQTKLSPSPTVRITRKLTLILRTAPANIHPMTTHNNEVVHKRCSKTALQDAYANITGMNKSESSEGRLASPRSLFLGMIRRRWSGPDCSRVKYLSWWRGEVVLEVRMQIRFENQEWCATRDETRARCLRRRDHFIDPGRTISMMVVALRCGSMWSL